MVNLLKIIGHVLLVLFFIVLVFPLPFTISNHPTNAPNSHETKFKTQKVSSFSPIAIYKDDDFTTCGCVSKGNGTQINPYIIENIYISNYTLDSYPITIINTRSFFIIQNISMVNFNSSNSLRMIYLWNTTNGYISHIQEQGFYCGVFILNSTRISINYSSFSLSIYYGLFAKYSYYINTSENNFTIGLWYYSCYESIISSNIIVNSTLLSDFGSVNTIFNNSFYNTAFSTKDNFDTIFSNKFMQNFNYYEVIFSAVNNTFTNNTLIGPGDGIRDYSGGSTIYNNTFDGLSFAIITSGNSTIIKDNFFLNIGMGVLSKSDSLFIVQNDFYNCSSGIEIVDSNSVYANNTFRKGVYGIRTESNPYDNIPCLNNTVSNNLFYDYSSAIYIDYSSNFTIYNNTILKGTYINIYLGYHANKSSITNNILISSYDNAVDVSYNKSNIWNNNTYSLYYNDSSSFTISGSVIDNSPQLDWTDTDHDGMPAWFERKYSLNLISNDSTSDPDADGLTNYQEYLAGTNPLISNSHQSSSYPPNNNNTTVSSTTTSSTNPSSDSTISSSGQTSSNNSSISQISLQEHLSKVEIYIIGALLIICSALITLLIILRNRKD